MPQSGGKIGTVPMRAGTGNGGGTILRGGAGLGGPVYPGPGILFLMWKMAVSPHPVRPPAGGRTRPVCPEKHAGRGRPGGEKRFDAPDLTA